VTFAHIDLIEKFPLVWSLHVGIFVVFIPFVLYAKKSAGGNFDFEKLRAMTPNWAGILLLVTFIYAMVNFGLFVFNSEGGGVPDIWDGQYVLHSHGKLIRYLTEQEYHMKKAYVLRAFSGHWLIFYLVPSLYFYLESSTNNRLDRGEPSENHRQF
jgi:hypothetical protein